MSSPLAGLPRLIVSPFLRRGLSRANEAHTPLTLSIRHDQESPRFGASYAHESELFLRMIRIRDHYLQRIAKYGHCLGEAHSVLFEVECCFVIVPFEFHDRSCLSNLVPT